MSLTKKHRLKRTKDISQTFQEGEVFFSFPLKIIYKQTNSEKFAPRVCVSVSKRYQKKACNRNLIKRRTRESFRKQLSSLANKELAKSLALDLMIVYVSKELESYQLIDRVISKFTRQLEKNNTLD